MQFPTVPFTLFFLILLGVWWCLPAQAAVARRRVLIVASLVFYSIADWGWTGVLLGVSFLTWIGSRWIDRSDGASRTWRGWMVVGMLISHLAGWKYSLWVTQLRNDWADGWGFAAWILPEWAYPIGLSFFTFHALGIVLGVWHKRLRPYGFEQVLAQVSFFPCLLAGPVLRQDAIAPRLEQPFEFTKAPWLEGVFYIALGMTFKWVFSTQAAVWSDPVFSGMATTGVEVWWGVHGYALQIFFDFAGYSLMAIGLARMLGFVLPENFTQPYHSTSAQQFWRSWHRSLSFFFRDHLYIDGFGGNKHGPNVAMLAAICTMLVSGLWHGASINFFVWGAWHAIWLTLERLLPGRARWPAWLGWIVSIEIVVWGWVWFRAESLSAAQDVFKQAFGGLPLGELPSTSVLVWSLLMVILVAVEGVLLARLCRVAQVVDQPQVSLLKSGCVCVLLATWAGGIIFWGPIGVPPFIYNGF